MTDIAANERRCGACTACCEGWLVSPVIPLRPGKPCLHKSAEGCTIYDTRPERPCRSFSCAWLLDDTSFPEVMRPDVSKVILSNVGEWEGWRVVSAAPVGEQIPERTLAVLRDFSLTQRCALLYCSLERSGEQFTGRGYQHAFGPPEFLEALAASSNEASFWQMSGAL
jgi:hypothetical protein